MFIVCLINNDNNNNNNNNNNCIKNVIKIGGDFGAIFQKNL